MHRFYLGLKELDEEIGGIAGGASIMLAGPPMSGKEALLNTIMSSGLRSGEAVILVEAREPGADVMSRLESRDTDLLGVVDCVTRPLGVSSRDTARVRYASSPVDLTGVGVRVNQFAEEFVRRNHGQIRLCIDSLSTMLMYSSLPTVFRFMHLFAGHIALQRNLGVYLVDEDMHDVQTIATLKQLCAGVLETKVEDDRSYLRLVGLTPRPTAWHEYVVAGGVAALGRAADD